MLAKISAKQFKMISGFLPNLSDKLPQNGDVKNWKNENDPKIIVIKRIFPPYSWIRKGKVEIKTPLKARTSRNKKIRIFNI